MEGDEEDRCPFYKGPSAASLFSFKEEDSDEDLIFSKKKSYDNVKSSLFDDAFEDPSKNTSSVSSLFDDTSSPPLPSTQQQQQQQTTNLLPWFESAQTWKQWVAVLLSVPPPSPSRITPSDESLPSSSQIIKDIIRETLQFTSSNTILNVPSTVSSIQELDTHLLLHTKSKSVLRFWKRATSRTSSGHESLCAVMSYLKRVTKSDDFVLRSIPDPKCTQLDETQVVIHNNFQVFKVSFHGDFSDSLSPCLVVSCRTIHRLLDNDDDKDNIVSTLEMVFTSSTLPSGSEKQPSLPPRPATPTESISSILMGSADLAYTYIKNQTRKQDTMFFSHGLGNMSSFRRVRT